MIRIKIQSQVFVLLKNRIVGDRGERREERNERGKKNENRTTKRGKVGRTIEKNCVPLKKSLFKGSLAVFKTTSTKILK